MSNLFSVIIRKRKRRKNAPHDWCYYFIKSDESTCVIHWIWLYNLIRATLLTSCTIHYFFSRRPEHFKWNIIRFSNWPQDCFSLPHLDISVSSSSKKKATRTQAWLCSFGRERESKWEGTKTHKNFKPRSVYSLCVEYLLKIMRTLWAE